METLTARSRKRTQRDYSLAFKLSAVEQVEKTTNKLSIDTASKIVNRTSLVA